MSVQGSDNGFDVIAIIGVGLIGGSIGMAARSRGLARRVVGIGRSEERLAKARDLQAIDEFTTDQSAGVVDADLVILCTPVGLIVPTLRDIAPHLKAGAIVTDVGSSKSQIVAEAEAIAPKGVHFVGGHPMAGSEESGVSAARPDLFEGAAYVITPSDNTNLSAMIRMKSFARALGARSLVMNPEEHDASVALISHVPHVLAAAALQVAYAAERQREGEVFSLAAGSFSDLTRVAGSPPVLWRDICLSNRKAIAGALLRFEQQLSEMRSAIESGDPVAVESIFQNALELREILVRCKE